MWCKWSHLQQPAAYRRIKSKQQFPWSLATSNNERGRKWHDSFQWTLAIPKLGCCLMTSPATAVHFRRGLSSFSGSHLVLPVGSYQRWETSGSCHLWNAQLQFSPITPKPPSPLTNAHKMVTKSSDLWQRGKSGKESSFWEDTTNQFLKWENYKGENY